MGRGSFSVSILLRVSLCRAKEFFNEYLNTAQGGTKASIFSTFRSPFSSLTCRVALMVTNIVELWKEKE